MEVWSTNDSNQIARFLNHLKAVAGNRTNDSFDYGGWDHMGGDEYKEHKKDDSVSFNDETFDFNINMEIIKGV